MMKMTPLKAMALSAVVWCFLHCPLQINATPSPTPPRKARTTNTSNSSTTHDRKLAFPSWVPLNSSSSSSSSSHTNNSKGNEEESSATASASYILAREHKREYRNPLFSIEAHVLTSVRRGAIESFQSKMVPEDPNPNNRNNPLWEEEFVYTGERRGPEMTTTTTTTTSR